MDTPLASLWGWLGGKEWDWWEKGWDKGLGEVGENYPAWNYSLWVGW